MSEVLVCKSAISPCGLQSLPLDPMQRWLGTGASNVSAGPAGDHVTDMGPQIHLLVGTTYVPTSRYKVIAQGSQLPAVVYLGSTEYSV
jgi:hypothetical protein